MEKRHKYRGVIIFLSIILIVFLCHVCISSFNTIIDAEPEMYAQYVIKDCISMIVLGCSILIAIYIPTKAIYVFFKKDKSWWIEIIFTIAISMVLLICILDSVFWYHDMLDWQKYSEQRTLSSQEKSILQNMMRAENEIETTENDFILVCNGLSTIDIDMGIDMGTEMLSINAKVNKKIELYFTFSVEYSLIVIKWGVL